MVVKQEIGKGINGKRGFPYGDGVIMKVDCEIPMCTVEKSSEIFEQVEDENENTDSLDEIEKNQDLKMFFENSINYTINPRVVVQECNSTKDPYDEDMAEVKYLYSKPVAFIIIGKPSPDNMKLGQKLAAYWGCLYIDPITCFNMEPEEADSSVLLWCRKHLSEGRKIPSEIVMRVMEQRALSNEAMHRGFVICGLPFAQQNGEPSAQEQMHMIFSWPMEPKIFIYVTCPNADVVTKNKQMYYDTVTGNYINKNVFSIHKEVLLVFSHEPRISTIGSVTDDVYKEIEQEKKLVAEKDVNHLVVMPDPNLEYILPRFQQAALPPVELYIAQVHPQFVIRVDGRTSPTHMLRIVKARLEALPLQPVYQPASIFKQKKQHSKDQGDETAETDVELEEQEEEEVGMEGEEDEFPLEFANLDEAYQELCSRDAIGKRFKWQKSNWRFWCPVSLHSGKVVQGEAKFSARFLNKLYFLSSLEALNAFLKNPRIYLLPPNPRPACKFIIVGHEYSGKSTAASYLAHAYQGKVIHFSTYTEDVKMKRKEMKEKSTRKAAIATKVNETNNEKLKQYEEAENKRKNDIELWKQAHLDAIQRTVTEYDENVEVMDPMFPELYEEIEMSRAKINFEEPLIPQLSFARCRWLYKHPEELIKYAPPQLFFPTPKPKLVNERDPTIVEYVDAAVKSAMEEEDPEPAFKRDGEILVEGIREAEKEFTAKTKGQKLDGGWVIDDMPLDPQIWEYLTNEGITPETVISLQDCSSEYTFLKTKKMAQLQEITEAKIKQQEVEGEGEGEEHGEEGRYEFGIGRKLLPEIGPDSEDLIKYAEQLKQFDEKWNSLKDSITSVHTPINVDVANKPLSNLLLEVGHKIQALYNVSAEPFTEEDRAEERNQNQNLDEMEPEEDEQIDEETENILKNRRMGETMTYCPVAYGTSHVLWKGKDDLLTKYKGKVYTFSDEEAMEKFMNEPWSYVKRHKPEKFLSPLRICIVGPAGSGKTSVGKLLARSLGLFHKDLALEINRTLIPKCKPLGRKAQYLEGRYIKNESFVRPSEETLQGEQPQIEGNEGEQSQINESENEINIDVENRKLRESVEQYLTDGTPMPETLLSKILAPLWNDEPYLCNGFVLSGFPWHPEDVDIMKKNYFIPDMIIYLSIPNEEIAKSRLLQEMKEFHEKEIAKQKRKAEKEQARLAALAAEGAHDSSSLHLELQDFLFKHLQQALSYEQVGERDEITAGENEFEGEEEEDLQEILRMQYEDDIQEWFLSDMEKLENIRALAEEHGFNWLEINAVNEMQDVCLRIVHEVYPLTLRSSSTFEQTFPITFEEAEQLLKTGYYFLSQFGRWCPVQLAAKEIPIQLFEPMNQKAQVFPVIHRRFIYFLGGLENLTLFQKDPLKYISNAQALPSIPVKIGIIGPPKSGKSSLAKRLSKELNIKVITIGQAIRYVLEDLSWTELALAVDDVLREGEVIPAKMAMRCVEAASMDPRSATQGYVFDGFPATTDQINEMASLNLFPYLIINLDCNLLTCVSRLRSQDETFFSRTPIFSSQLLQHKYSCWYPIFSQVKRQLNSEYHNVETLDANHVIWWLYKRTTDHLYKIMKSIYDYYADVTIGKPGKLEYMCITPNEFKDRQSKYLHFCPGCLQNGRLISGGTPPDKKGLVQYKVHFYWICESHFDEFLKNPLEFIPPTNTSELPDHLPHIPTEDDEDLELVNDGYCIVTYADSIPERILQKGSPEFSVIYGNKKYMFASAEQREKFLSDPSYYGDKKICMLPLRMPAMNVLRFPTLGFLEQTVSTHLHSALLGVGTERPKYPGLPLDLSAAIYMGYYLKLINSATSAAQTEMLTKAQEEFLHRCNILKKFCHKTKIRNPLLHPEDGEENIPKTAFSEDDL